MTGLLCVLLAGSILGVYLMAMRHDNYLHLRAKRGIPSWSKHGD